MAANEPLRMKEGENMSVEEKMDALLLSLLDKEREVLSEKLSDKGNA